MQCDAETTTAAATTNKTVLRSTIIPVWGDVAKGETKLSTTVIASYWDKLDRQDIERYASTQSTKTKQNAARNSIQDFYYAANSCLNKELLIAAQVPEGSFSTYMNSLKDCINKKAKIPRFTIVISPTTKPSTTPAPTAKPSTTTAKPGATLAPTAKPSSATLAPTTAKPGTTPAPTEGDETEEIDGEDDGDESDDDEYADTTGYVTTASVAYTSSDTFAPMAASWVPSPAPETECPSDAPTGYFSTPSFAPAAENSPKHFQ